MVEGMSATNLRMDVISPYNALNLDVPRVVVGVRVWQTCTFSCLWVAEISLSRGRRGFSGHLSVPRWHSALLPESGPFRCGG